MAVTRGRAEPDRDARQAGNRLDEAHELRRAEHAPVLFEARGKVGDPHGAALTIRQHGADHRGVAYVFGVRRHEAVEHDVGEPLLLVAGEQAAEHRIAVIAREAPPHDPRQRIDQRERAAVADHREIEVLLGCGDLGFRLVDVHRFSLPPRTISAIQRRTSVGVSNVPAIPST